MAQLVEPAVQHWYFPRSSAGTGVLVRFGVERGLSAERLLAGSGLTEERLSDPAGEVTAHQELRVVRNLAAALPDVGLAVGREYHATTFGMLGFAFLSSPTMRDAVEVALRYYDLSFAFSIPRVSVAGGQVRLVFDDRLLPADVARFGAVSFRMPEVARQLGVSTRTLRRRLDEEVTSFRALLDEVREALADELLTRGAVPVEDVAVRLGYAEAASFVHAFRRWKGVTPTAFLRHRNR
jgi:AraC-like DNA-binding protein